MIELPEALSRAKELNHYLTGKKIIKVLLPTSFHKFCWFEGDVASYPSQLEGRIMKGARGFGIFVEIECDQGVYVLSLIHILLLIVLLKIEKSKTSVKRFFIITSNKHDFPNIFYVFQLTHTQKCLE